MTRLLKDSQRPLFGEISSTGRPALQEARRAVTSGVIGQKSAEVIVGVGIRRALTGGGTRALRNTGDGLTPPKDRTCSEHVGRHSSSCL